MEQTVNHALLAVSIGGIQIITQISFTFQKSFYFYSTCLANCYMNKVNLSKRKFFRLSLTSRIYLCILFDSNLYRRKHRTHWPLFKLVPLKTEYNGDCEVIQKNQNIAFQETTVCHWDVSNTIFRTFCAAQMKIHSAACWDGRQKSLRLSSNRPFFPRSHSLTVGIQEEKTPLWIQSEARAEAALRRERKRKREEDHEIAPPTAVSVQAGVSGTLSDKHAAVQSHLDLKEVVTGWSRRSGCVYFASWASLWSLIVIRLRLS